MDQDIVDLICEFSQYKAAFKRTLCSERAFISNHFENSSIWFANQTSFCFSTTNRCGAWIDSNETCTAATF
ncbi:hypothetical protein AV530_003185 [Patagioenas fasciata monilis]|uniref:Uncharacterized protein n=1 Tax=Patagioenas fasciata monilis TaxID=372326 RepID=A0A1V4KXG8_PATFA|nr:hypothetical protein AV530_003185 [Patagioenas fasciata monilis]